MVEPLLPNIPFSPGVLGQRFGQFFGAQTILSNLTVANGALISFVDPKGLTGWQTLVLSANWSAAGFASVGYRKDAMGFVHLRGVLIVGAGATNPAATMPVGYRPAQDTYLAALAGAGSIALGTTLGMKELSVTSATGAIAGNVATNDYVMLDGITWLGEV